MIDASMSEVAALARKAARGVGYSWSMADEAAFATRWLCQQGFDGMATLAELLIYVDRHSPSRLQLRSVKEPWQGDNKGLCPLSTGAALSDFACEPNEQAQPIHGLLAPMLLLPYVAAVLVPNSAASAADSATLVVQLNCDHGTAYVVRHGGQCWLDAPVLTPLCLPH